MDIHRRVIGCYDWLCKILVSTTAHVQACPVLVAGTKLIGMILVNISKGRSMHSSLRLRVGYSGTSRRSLLMSGVYSLCWRMGFFQIRWRIGNSHWCVASIGDDARWWFREGRANTRKVILWPLKTQYLEVSCKSCNSLQAQISMILASNKYILNRFESGNLPLLVFRGRAKRPWLAMEVCG